MAKLPTNTSGSRRKYLATCCRWKCKFIIWEEGVFVSQRKKKFGGSTGIFVKDRCMKGPMGWPKTNLVRSLSYLTLSTSLTRTTNRKFPVMNAPCGWRRCQQTSPIRWYAVSEVILSPPKIGVLQTINLFSLSTSLGNANLLCEVGSLFPAGVQGCMVVRSWRPALPASPVQCVASIPYPARRLRDGRKHITTERTPPHRSVSRYRQDCTGRESLGLPTRFDVGNIP